MAKTGFITPELFEFFRELADAFAALHWLRAMPQVDRDVVGLIGWSKGGSAALAAGRPGAAFLPAYAAVLFERETPELPTDAEGDVDIDLKTQISFHRVLAGWRWINDRQTGSLESQDVVEKPDESWQADWRTLIGVGQSILVCDVGGGTTDFTLVTLTAVEGGSPRFDRIAVGDQDVGTYRLAVPVNDRAAAELFADFTRCRDVVGMDMGLEGIFEIEIEFSDQL